MWNKNKNQLFKACERLYNLCIETNLDEENDEDYFVACLSMDVVANCIPLLAFTDTSENLSFSVNVRTIWEALALLKLYDEKRIDETQLRLFRAQSNLFVDSYFFKMGEREDEVDGDTKRDFEKWIEVFADGLKISKELAKSIHRREFLFFTKDPSELSFKAFNLISAVYKDDKEKCEDYKKLCVYVHPYYSDSKPSKQKVKWFSDILEKTFGDVGEYLTSHGLYRFGPKDPSADSVAKRAYGAIGRYLNTLAYAAISSSLIVCPFQVGAKISDFDLVEAKVALNILRQMDVSLCMGFPHETLLIFKGFVEHMAVWNRVEDDGQVDGFKAYTDARFLSDKSPQSDWDNNFQALSKAYEDYYSKAYQEGKTKFIGNMREAHLHFLSEKDKDYIALAGDYIYEFVGRLGRDDTMFNDKGFMHKYLLMEYQRSVKYSHGRGYLLAFKDCWANLSSQLETVAALMIRDKLRQIAERSGNKDPLIEFSFTMFRYAAGNFNAACEASRDGDRDLLARCENRDKEINDLIDQMAASIEKQAAEENPFDCGISGN